jgi:hypothetical protein
MSVLLDKRSATFSGGRVLDNDHAAEDCNASRLSLSWISQ